jgi:diguanylate cyclase (GGDEF)-like protein
MDIDYFKSYNDLRGHRAGDDCLAAVGKAVGQSLQRPADLAARYGGDEFVLVLPDTYMDGALDVGQRVLAAIAECGIPHSASAFGRVTLSIGVAVVVPAPNHTLQELLERADRALYVAKQAGRNRVVATPTHFADEGVAE